MAVPKEYNSDIFINCPFDAGYARTFEALRFAVFALGFRPRTAREVDDGADIRINRIMRIIGECRYGIHDISRTELDPVIGLPRFNMPLELGIFLGARRFGDDDQEKKSVLILDREQYRYRDFISDLAGIDIHSHGGDVLQAVREVREWLVNASRRRLMSSARLVEQYEAFMADLPDMAHAEGFDPDNIPYVDFDYFVALWLAR